MKRWLFAASLASSALLLMHYFGGSAEVYEPLLQANASNILKGYISLLWHAMTAVLLINSAVLLLASLRPGQKQALAWPVVAQFLVFALLSVVISVTTAGSILAVPQWIFFSLIAFLALPGLRVAHDR